MANLWKRARSGFAYDVVVVYADLSAYVLNKFNRRPECLAVVVFVHKVIEFALLCVVFWWFDKKCSQSAQFVVVHWCLHRVCVDWLQRYDLVLKFQNFFVEAVYFLPGLNEVALER